MPGHVLPCEIDVQVRQHLNPCQGKGIFELQQGQALGLHHCLSI